MKFGFNRPVVSGEKMFENVDKHIHTQTTEAYLYYKLTNEPKGSGELKIQTKCSWKTSKNNPIDYLPYIMVHI